MPSPSKWDNEAEQTLLFAIILSKGEGEKTRYNWPAVHEVMTQCGHTFSKDAISQHFTKFMVKDFKAKHENLANGSDNVFATPVKDAAPTTPKKGASAKKTPASRKRGKIAVVKAERGDEVEDDDSDADVPVTPTKKPKKAASDEKNEGC